MKVFLDGAAAAFRQAFGEGKAELMHGQFDAFRVAQITGSDEDADLLVVSVRFAVRAKKSRLVLVDAVGGGLRTKNLAELIGTEPLPLRHFQS